MRFGRRSFSKCMSASRTKAICFGTPVSQATAPLERDGLHSRWILLGIIIIVSLVCVLRFRGCRIVGIGVWVAGETPVHGAASWSYGFTAYTPVFIVDDFDESMSIVLRSFRPFRRSSACIGISVVCSLLLASALLEVEVSECRSAGPVVSCGSV